MREKKDSNDPAERLMEGFRPLPSLQLSPEITRPRPLSS